MKWPPRPYVTITHLKRFKTMNSHYLRVTPRDFFNEAKLLKCMGRLCLLIHDELTPVKMTRSENGEPFNIALTMDEFLIVTNTHIAINGTVCRFKTAYNSKENYPFYVEHEEIEYLVFDEQGEFHKEFIDFCNTTTPQPQQ